MVKVDPSTVDGRIRAMGAAVNHFLEREDIKTNTLFRTCKVLTLIFFLVIFGELFLSDEKLMQRHIKHQVFLNKKNMLSK
ncbi:hypothetical protein ACP0HM_00480 [Escherichia coli]